LPGGGLLAAGAGELESSKAIPRTVALVKAFKDDFSFFTIVLFSFELLFILELPKIALPEREEVT
jgi:hypothetical protein